MRFIYTMILVSYYSLLSLIRPFHKRARDFFEFRNNVKYNGIPKSKTKRILVQCPSLGEYEMADNLILELRNRYEVYVSFYSDSGYRIISKKDPEQTLIYPLDFTSSIRKFYNSVNPDLVIFVSNEFWINSLHYLSKEKIPFMFYGLRVSLNHWISKNYLKTLSNPIRNAKLYVSRSAESTQVLRKHGFKPVALISDPRIKQSKLNTTQAYTSFLDDLNQQKIIYGSIWKEDIVFLKDAIDQLKSHLHIIAPHDISSKNINWIRTQFTGTVLFSELEKGAIPRDFKIIIVDNIGHLKYLYRYGQACYIGGGLKAALHNIFEPAAYNIPVFYAGQVQSFPETLSLEEAGLSKHLDSSQTFKENIEELGEVLVSDFNLGQYNTLLEEDEGTFDEINKLVGNG